MAVLGLYWRRFTGMARGIVTGGEDRGIALSVGLAFIPAAVAGLLIGDLVKERLFGLAPIAWAWVVGGLVILWLERIRQDHEGNELEAIRLSQAGLIGVMQVLALWPGTSRSLVTILGGRLAGLSTAAAVEFSFLLGAVTLLAASLYEGSANLDVILSEIGWGPAVVGFLIATISAAVAARWLVTFLTRHSLAVFGWYRIVIGFSVLLFVS